MTPAELKTIHEAIGVPTTMIANIAGVTDQTVWRNESPDRDGDVSPGVASATSELLCTFEDAAADYAENLKQMGASHVPRHALLHDFYAAVPQLRDWGPRAHAMFVVRVRQLTGLPVQWAGVPA